MKRGTSAAAGRTLAKLVLLVLLTVWTVQGDESRFKGPAARYVRIASFKEELARWLRLVEAAGRSQPMSFGRNGIQIPAMQKINLKIVT